MDGTGKEAGAAFQQGQRVSQYEVDEVLAPTRFGFRYLAHHMYRPLQVFLEVFQPPLAVELREQFQGRAKDLIKLEHPHILRVREQGVQQHYPFLVLDYLACKPFSVIYTPRSIQPLRALLPRLRKIADGLSYAHSRQVWHGDIRPETVLVSDNNNVLLRDFLVPAVALNQERLRAQRAPAEQEAMLYIAPEQIQGQGSAASDQYSLATLVYTLLSGKTPFTGSAMEVASQKRSAPAPALRQIMPESIMPGVERVIMKGLDREPTNRYPAIALFMEALEQAQSGQGSPVELLVTPAQPTAMIAPPPPARGPQQAPAQLPSNDDYSTRMDEPVPPLTPLPPMRGQQSPAPQPMADLPNRFDAPATPPRPPQPQPPLAPPVQPPQQQPMRQQQPPAPPTPIPPAPPAPPMRQLQQPMQQPAPPMRQPQQPAPPMRQPQQPAPPTPIPPAPPAPPMRQPQQPVYQPTMLGNPPGPMILPGQVAATPPPPAHQPLAHPTEAAVPAVRPARAAPPAATVPPLPPARRRESSSVSRRVFGVTLVGVAAAAGVGGWYYLSQRFARATPPPVNGPGTTPVATQAVVNNQNVLIFSGHLAAVNAVCWSPDGSLIASASDDTFVQIFEAATGKRRLIYRHHSEEVATVSWSPNGKLIASGGQDRTAQVWSPTDGAQALVYTGHSKRVNGVSWSSNSLQVASGSDDMTVQTWLAAGGANQFTFQGHTAGVLCVAWQPDDTSVASGSWDGTLRDWATVQHGQHFNAGDQIFSYGGHGANEVTAIAWSPNGPFLASAGADQTVQISNAGDGSLRPPAFTDQRSATHINRIFSLAWSPDGNSLASGDEDGNVHVWHTTGRKTFFIYKGHQGAVNAVAWSPDGKSIASASSDNTVHVWQPR